MLDCLEHLELRGQLGAFREELYRGVECEVRVGDVLSNPFVVTTLRSDRTQDAKIRASISTSQYWVQQ